MGGLTPTLFSPEHEQQEQHLVKGQLLDQPLVGALGMLLARRPLLRKLFVPTRQEAHGRYCVQFFKEGNWQPVFMDDLLPCSALGKPLLSGTR
jgi:hypothetical protein